MASDSSRARIARAHAPLAAFALALAYISYIAPAGKAQRRRAQALPRRAYERHRREAAIKKQSSDALDAR